ncbi:hypothetical protein Cha6605_0230 [Chamaesiphon minutus PCC 6605]|uniref:Uncharacterized protein n=1 Tax=Chamaesiphon minutus (strain ATCC 27169 / PCC 6605) TaxID=1173020 RepID=K9U8W5_CHAP6|nr:hypothetical protein Cha6605_0230 [Chamaesiphon minutus PCC 6605]
MNEDLAYTSENIANDVKSMISQICQIAPIQGCSEDELNLLESNLNIISICWIH